MRIQPPCIACFVRQALETTRRAGGGPELEWAAAREVCRLAASLSPDSTSPEFAELVYAAVYRLTGNADPFLGVKQSANALALDLEPRLMQAVEKSADPLLAAVKLSIAGNSMDLGVVREYGDVGGLAERVLRTDLAIDDYRRLLARLREADSVVMVGDNNGEIVFDRMLLEQMKRIRDCARTYVVRGGPVINDVTREDAVDVGIDRLARIVDTGSAAPGLVLSACSHAARDAFDAADLVISKGQGNYEALSDAPRDVFFLLLVKCDVVSKDLGASLGGAVVKHHVPRG